MHYPYDPTLPAPEKLSSIDFASPTLEGALRMLVRGIREECAAFVPPDNVLLFKEKIKVWDGNEIECYVFEPADEKGTKDSMLYCHGGGFFLPVQPMMMKLAAEYSANLGIKVYLPEYRIFPEYRNPYPFKDCLSVLERMVKEEGKYLLYGESAGGTLAAGLVLYERDHGMKAPSGQCLVYPVLDNRCSRYPSMRLYSEAAWPLKNNLSMWREYLKNGTDGLDGYLVPMQAEDLSSLPMTYIEAEQIDILHDEAVKYAERLKEAGNVTVLSEIKGSYHGFDSNTDNEFVLPVIENRIGIMKRMLGITEHTPTERN